MKQYSHHEKVKVTIECTPDERAYIKMLAAKAHLNLSPKFAPVQIKNSIFSLFKIFK